MYKQFNKDASWRDEKYRFYKVRKVRRNWDIKGKFKKAFEYADLFIKKIMSKLKRSDNMEERPPRRHRDRKRMDKDLKKKIIYTSVAIFLILMMVGGISFVGVLAWVSRNLPDPNQISDRNVIESTKIYDRTGENILYEVHGDVNRTMVELEDIPEFVKNATLAAEDKDFYSHKGFDITGIIRAVIVNVIKGRKAQGGSTITQQLIKNTVLTKEKTYTRKIKELILAYKIEQEFTKDQILKIYLNEIPYGGAVYGIESAAHKFFGKSVNDLDLAEATLLASLPQAPTFYSPYGSNTDRLIVRQNWVLDQMVEAGSITKEEAEEAKAKDVLSEIVPFGESILAPHFVMYVREYLTEKYGEKVVEEGGLRVYTTLDLDKQKIAEEVIAERIEDNEKNYNATNASLVAIDPKTGQILAMVGSRDFFSKEYDGQVNVATRLRQPGSSMKPLIYAAAFEKGYTPNTILYDVETNFKPKGSNQKDYIPLNYDLKENGPVSMRKALAGSLNIPAVKAYYLVGQDDMFKIFEKLGYTSITDKEKYGLGLVLGNADVKLLEHVGAYAALAREGEARPVASILKVTDRDGNVLEEFEDKPIQAIDKEAVRMLNDVLSDNEARAYKFGLNSPLQLGKRPVAAKTGTTNDYRDAWTMGYTSSLAVGVWTGNNDNSKMSQGASGSYAAAPIWHDFMARALEGTPIELFKEPEIPETGKDMLDGKEAVETEFEIDRASGKLATEYTPESFREKKIYKEVHSILYEVDKSDPLGPVPEHPELDAQYEGWEEAIQDWLKRKQEKECAEDPKCDPSKPVEVVSEEPPTEYDDLHVPANRPTISIMYPKAGESIESDTLRSDIRFSAPRGIGRVEYYIDDMLAAVVDGWDFNLDYRLPSFISNGSHRLKVIAYDDIDNSSSEDVSINISRAIREADIEWLKPGAGREILLSQFPYPLEVKLQDISSIKKVDFIVKKDNREKLIASEIAPRANKVQVVWYLEDKEPGYYTLLAKAYDKNDNILLSDEIVVMAKEDPPVEKEEADKQ